MHSPATSSTGSPRRPPATPSSSVSIGALNVAASISIGAAPTLIEIGSGSSRAAASSYIARRLFGVTMSMPSVLRLRYIMR